MNSVILKTLEIFLSVNTGLFKTKRRNTTHSESYGDLLVWSGVLLFLLTKTSRLLLIQYG